MSQNSNFDEDLHLAIEYLCERLELEEGSPAYGVSQQVIHAGYTSLSPKQKALYDAKVMPLLRKHHERSERDRVLMSNPD